MGNFCYRCMLPTVQNGVCTRCGEQESSGSSNGENALQPGTSLGKGRLTIGRKLGSGGFGVTYIAFDNKLNRRVALKEFMPNYLAVRSGIRIVPKQGQNAAYEKSMNSFMKEARALYELRAHPNIVHVISVFKENNTAYYTMEMLEGESLLNYLRRKKKISANRAFQMLLPIMKAIQYVHSKKMIHRDISPDNIMLCEDPSRPGVVVPKLIDFGAAHVAIEGYSLSYPGVKKNGFSPLEQNWEGNAQGPWTDVYSFCATFYSAIVGSVPVSAQYRSEQDRDPMKPPREMGADISPAMQDVLMHGLKLQYAERIQSMDELIRQFSQVVESSANSTVMEVSRQMVADPKRPAFRRVMAWLLEIGLLAAGFMYLRDNESVLSGLGLEMDPILLTVLVLLAAVFLLDLLLTISAGATFGQLFFGLALRDEDGERKPGFGSAFAYSLLYASFGMPVGFLCGIIWLFSGKNIGPLDMLTGVTLGRRRQPAVAPGMGGAISGPVSRPVSGQRPDRQPEQPPQKAPEPVAAVPPPAPAAVSPSGQKASPSSGQQAKTSADKQTRPEIKPEPRPKPGPVLKEEPGTRPAHQPAPAAGNGIKARPSEPPVRKPQSADEGKNAPAARLLCIRAGESAISLQGRAVMLRNGASLGKNNQKASIVIPDNTVSGLHCSFRFEQGKGWTIKDEGSTNGTFVNGVRLPSGGSCPLKNGARIITGKETFELKC